MRLRNVTLVKVVSRNVARDVSRSKNSARLARMSHYCSKLVRPRHAGLQTGSLGHWDSYMWAADYHYGNYRTWCNRWPMVVRMSDRVEVEWFEQVGPHGKPVEYEISVGDVALIAAARVIPKDPKDGEPFIAASIYAHWNQKDGAAESSGSGRGSGQGMRSAPMSPGNT